MRLSELGGGTASYKYKEVPVIQNTNGRLTVALRLESTAPFYSRDFRPARLWSPVRVNVPRRAAFFWASTLRISALKIAKTEKQTDVSHESPSSQVKANQGGGPSQTAPHEHRLTDQDIDRETGYGLSKLVSASFRSYHILSSASHIDMLERRARVPRRNLQTVTNCDARSKMSAYQRRLAAHPSRVSTGPRQPARQTHQLLRVVGQHHSPDRCGSLNPQATQHCC